MCMAHAVVPEEQPGPIAKLKKRKLTVYTGIGIRHHVIAAREGEVEGKA